MPEHLTDRSVAALKPAAKRYLVFDDDVEGLAIQVQPSGGRSWVFHWTEKFRQRRVTIGKFPVWTVGKARTHAGKMRLKADAGEEVIDQRGSLVAELIEAWRETVKLTRRPSTATAYSYMIDKNIVPEFGKMQPKDITRNAVEAWHGRIAQQTPIHANRVLGTLSSFMTWLEHDKLVERNVCRGVKRRPENQRHVYLSAEEIPKAHEALRQDNYSPEAGKALRLALLTGCRIGEVINLKREQIDVAHLLWVKPAATTKQKKVHVLPLQKEALSLALDLLELGPPDYETIKRCWERARKIVGREDVRIHDLRHSRASSLARKGASLVMIGKVLGHNAPATTARYSHLVASDLRDVIEAAD
ncbi:tyrosine-type recombinase/integrase [Bradyrhizobium diazoefficiens]|nr:site-specific integrase [Bradyrhizobium diazoefficiens]MBR0848810.1 tyrosine-type recombinase/integrase [Bradyrhizobium diazoefficiens]